MKNTWKVLVPILLVIAVAVGIIALLPMAAASKITFGLYVAISTLGVSSAILYLIGLRGFRHQFRVGYRYMSLGMLFFAAAIFEFPFFDAARNSQELPWLYYVALLPFFIFFVLYFLGIRKLASILNIKSIFLSLPLWLAISLILGVVAGVISLFLPIVTTNSDASTLHIIIGVAVAGLTLLAASLTLLFHLMQHAGPLYKRAFAWNFYGFLAFFVSQLLDPSAFLPPDNWYVAYGTVVPFFLVVACFLMSAIEFSRIPYLEQHARSGGAPGQQKTSIDVVMSLAFLVSVPQAIDVALDKVRRITAQLGPGQRLAAAQQVEMAQVYRKIEEYLINQEQARHYTKEGLRQLVEVQFKGAVDEPVFWHRLDSPTPQASSTASSRPSIAS